MDSGILGVNPGDYDLAIHVLENDMSEDALDGAAIICFGFGSELSADAKSRISGLRCDASAEKVLRAIADELELAECADTDFDVMDELTDSEVILAAVLRYAQGGGLLRA